LLFAILPVTDYFCQFLMGRLCPMIKHTVLEGHEAAVDYHNQSQPNRADWVRPGASLAQHQQQNTVDALNGWFPSNTRVPPACRPNYIDLNNDWNVFYSSWQVGKDSWSPSPSA
jgi:hypothetical protein